MCNQDIGPERTKIPFFKVASQTLIRGCSEKRAIYYFKIKINLYAVISHSIPFIIYIIYNQKIEATLALVWFGHHCTILIVSYSFCQK